MAASETPQKKPGSTLKTLARATRQLWDSIQQSARQTDSARQQKASDRATGRPSSAVPEIAEQAWAPAVFVEQFAPSLRPAQLHGHEPLIALSAHTAIPAPVGQRARRSVPQDVKIAVSVRDGGRCRRCGSTHQLHFDHVIPISRGGANTVANVQLLCETCNRAKGAKPRLGIAQACEPGCDTAPRRREVTLSHDTDSRKYSKITFTTV